VIERAVWRGPITLNRFEHAPTEPDRYRRIGHDPAAVPPRASPMIAMPVTISAARRSSHVRRTQSSSCSIYAVQVANI